jgi:hypothetical protein
MALTHKRKLASRKLEVDKLRAKGHTQVQIAKKLKVSIKTIKRDMAVLDEELRIEPQYSEERKKNREIAVKTLWRWIDEITCDLEKARIGSESLEKTGKPPLQREIKNIKDEETMLGVAVGEVKSIEVTEKTFGPDWKAIAQMLKVRLEHLVTFAKLWGLLVERETQITKETTKEGIVYGEVVLPKKATEDDWQQLADEYRETGRKPRVVRVEDLERVKSEEGVEVWKPKKTSPPPEEEGEEEEK